MLLRSPLRLTLRSPLYSPLVGKWGDDGLDAVADLGDEPRGFALNFLDMSYAIRESVGAEIELGTDMGFALDFVDEFGISYALRG